MSEYTERLNLADLVARIERQQAKTRKLVAERNRLDAAAAKLNRDRFVAPILTAGAIGAAVAALLPTVLRAMGVHL